MEKRMVNMRYPAVLLRKIDAYQDKAGFNTRTHTIIHLIQIGLNAQSTNQEEKG